MVDTNFSALFDCRVCGCRLTTVAPERLCEVCGFIEAAPFQLPSGAEQALALHHTDAVVELEELVISGVREAPAWTEALKNLVFFFVATGQHGGALEGRQKEPWVQRLVAKALEEVEHRHYNASNAQPLKFVA